MDSRTALGLRLSSLLLRGNAPASVGEIVSWFGAMQSQDANSMLWSLGARLPGWTMSDVNDALEKRTVLRTWPMRGTVHLVPAADAHWMLELMGVRALAGAEKRRATIGLDAATADRAVALLGDALAGGRRLTRSECMATLASGGIEVSGQRGYHLLWYASQQGVTAIAPHVGKEQTFVLLDEWAPAPSRPSRAEALGLIALRYFRSHGPATRKDFAGWTGLTMADCKTGIAVAGDALAAVDVDGVEMIASAAALGSASPFRGWLALPGFDEYMLGYKDRSLMASPAELAAIVPGGNGVFQSTLVRDGRVVATWKRVLGSKGVTVTVLPLTSLSERDHRAIEKALTPFADFLGVPLTVKNP
ncbi:winged helix DNA-binding domain-containing protein [Paractinoplanes rhizophilus]|uniref:Winged helix DNA-binding domain-containing protein n=1 Tax=Paractinoplanes rhizophilus TaxID=1416877 RepID=A0ABW2HHX9_9ACTN